MSTPRDLLDQLLPADRRQLYVAGDWVASSTGTRLDVIDPADGTVLTDVADGSLDDARAALDAAVAAQPEWAATAPVSGARSCAAPSSW